MNKKFLYKKMKVHTLGFLDDSDNNDDSWMFDDSLILGKKFRESPIDELIIELVDIFRIGKPNASKLIALFGFSYNDVERKKNLQGNIIINKYYNIERRNKDIISIEMQIEEMSDKTLMIRYLYLCLANLPPIEVMKNKINEVYDDVCYQKSGGLMICENGCNIKIFQSN